MSKKYSINVEEVTAAEGNSWKAEIVRRVTARKNIVSKSQEGFASEAEANTWGEVEMKAFMRVESIRRERRAG